MGQNGDEMHTINLLNNVVQDADSFTDAVFDVSGDTEAGLLSQGAHVYKMKSNIDLSAYIPKGVGDSTVVLPTQQAMDKIHTAYASGSQSKAPSFSPYDPNNDTLMSVLSIYNAL